ncbi:MAG: helix-turn-helix domain-containing protein [Verrucomicrobiota bacterium]|nr:helix-turn-helix domain-containing protein [Verrucomicrobiota bacterium]
MSFSDESSAHALQLFVPDPNAVYTLEATAHLAQVSRRMILIYCKRGLLSPVVDPACGGYSFNDEAIRILRRIEDLRAAWGNNLAGIKLVLDLMSEVNACKPNFAFCANDPRALRIELLLPR